MALLLGILASVLDMICTLYYFHIFMPERKSSVSDRTFAAGFIGMELLLFAMSTVTADISGNFISHIRMIINIICTFILTFYYTAPFAHRMFVVLSYVFISGFSEDILGFILSNVPAPDQMPLHGYQFEACAILSKLILFVMFTLINLIWNHNRKQYTFSYSLLILIIPILSLMIDFAPPLYNLIWAAPLSYIYIQICLFMINLASYYLLDNILKVMELRQHESQLSQQLMLQLKNYQQISDAYRNSRSIIHDTKKHMLYIAECVQSHQYDKILPYTDTSLEKLQSCYQKVDSGNLVIDAFLSYYQNLAATKSISWNMTVKIQPELIGYQDYDLSIILGNLLDNAIQACEQIPESASRKITIIMHTYEHKFTMDITNTFLPDSQKRSDPLLHGYGLENVERCVKELNGIYNTTIHNNTYQTMITLPATQER